MPTLQSTSLHAVTYDERRRRLKVTFRESGRCYVYENVPQEIYDGLLFAGSIGAFFNTHIRDHYRFREA